jgi:arabinofuranosyltransferase
MALLSLGYAATRELFFTTTFISYAVCAAAGVVLVRWAGTIPRGALLIVWLLTSKAFVDYTASGLENPLSYLLLAVFYSFYLTLPTSWTADLKGLRYLVLLASLAFLTRPDAVVLYALPLVDVAWRAYGRHRWGILRPVLAGLSPAIVWSAFATIYYGFPLPNTYYAKVANGLPETLMARQGFAYFLNSVRFDPLTLGTIGLAVLWGARAPRPQQLGAFSAALSVAYTVSIGGDFMSGRFFTLPFLLAAMVVVPDIAAMAASWAVGGLILYTVLVPLVPIKTGPDYDGAWPWRTQNGIKDERGHHHRATNVLFFSPFREIPDFIFAREGRSFRESEEKVAIHGSIGMFGLYAGPAKHVIDRNALSDPLLARMPVSRGIYFEFYASHYFRDIPDGYIESCAKDANLLTDPLLHNFYDRIRNVTRGPLFRADRFRDIWLLNTGGSRAFREQVAAQQTIHYSVRAENERFFSDIGARDDVRGTLSSNGRAGLLQYGPRIPLPAGSYTVRWIGRLTSRPESEAGVVDVIVDDGSPLKRQPIPAEETEESGLLAELEFELNEPATTVEYRLYTNQGVRLVLERVELRRQTP